MYSTFLTFHGAFVALSAVKEWARYCGIYSNVLGFLGGINWAILVAFVCQRYPRAPPAALLHRYDDPDHHHVICR